MRFLDRILTAFAPRKTPPPVPVPPPALTRVGNEWIDLAALSPEELMALEARINAQIREQEARLNAELHARYAVPAAAPAARDFATWVDALRILFGPTLAHQLSQQEIVPGMQIKHLIASFGPATAVRSSGEGVRFVYGDEQTGSYFDIEGETIVYAHIGLRPNPPVELAPSAPES